MLIIFDLDDTLIDTSGSITPYALENALHAMIACGLSVAKFSEALDLLKRMDSMALSGGEALAEFVEIHDGETAHLQVGKEKLYGDIPADLTIFPVEGALELLAELSLDHQLALVTCGKLSIQMEKLKKAGIDSTLFSNIIVSEDRNKKIHYKSLLEEFGCPASEVLVCGDRIGIDLAPAKDLGCRTVQMRWGRGLNSLMKKGAVDYQISALKELKEIVSHIINFSAF